MTIRLPSRYEDLDSAFRGRLKANQSLLALVKQAYSSMEISGGIRFLPVFGSSGSGKSSAAFELGTHLPELHVEQLPRECVDNPTTLRPTLADMQKRAKGKRIVAVVDQYEEVSAQRTAIPSTFVEALSLLDREPPRLSNILFVWLTTSREFQASLSAATSRNERILVSSDFELESLSRDDWPPIIEDTFQFHNQEKDLSDYEILSIDLEDISHSQETIGRSIELVGEKLAKYATTLHDLSTYQVVMLWPVTDGLRISRIQQFTDARQGYKLDWNAWFRQLNSDDQQQLPLREYNKARLYFDVRLVPIAAADLFPLCRELDNDSYKLGSSYLDRFSKTHLYSIVSGSWNPDGFSPLRERESKRGTEAKDWYATVTVDPTKLGKRIARCFSELGISATHEQTITSLHSKVRADVLVDRTPVSPPNVIIEMKAFSPENTMPSTIAQAIGVTLKRHAQFAGFLQRI
jgi:adenylate kinase family enzyme